MNFLKIFCDSFIDNWDNPAITSYSAGLTLTYGGLGARIERVNRLFEMFNVNAGTHIAVVGNNSIDWITNYIAAMIYGAVVVTVQVTYDSDDMFSLLASADTEILFIDPEFMPRHFDLSEMPSLKLVISQDTQTVLMSRNELYPNSQLLLDSLDQNFVNLFPSGFMPSDISVPKRRPESPAAIFFTAGTTGAPKPVMLTSDNMEGNIIYGMKASLFPHGSHTLTTSSVGNVWGTIYNVIVPLASGAHITVFNEFYNPPALVKALKRVKPRRIILSPRQLRAIYTLIENTYRAGGLYRLLKSIPFGDSLVQIGMRRVFNRAMGGNCREVVVGSANIGRKLRTKLNRAGIKYTVSYGLVECGGLACYVPYGEFDPETVGRPIRSVLKCRLRPLEIDGLPEGVGILELSGMTVMKCYCNDPESTREAFAQDGWLSTRDLAMIDDDGQVIIIGCLDTIIHRPGGTIVPERLEATLLDIPGIHQAVVVDREGVTTAIIVPDVDSIAGDPELTLRGIVESVNARIPAFARIEDIVISMSPLDITLKGTVARYKYY